VPAARREGLRRLPILLGRGAPPQTMTTQVFLERPQIAEAVGSYFTDRKARR
jgi:hypothetical protein